jgi:hypothetical protein
MKNIDNCPVTHVSLHTLLRNLERNGVLGQKKTYHPGIGAGSRYTLNDEPLEVRTGFVGRLDWLDLGDEQPCSLSEPHDIAYVGRTLVAISKSLS